MEVEYPFREVKIILFSTYLLTSLLMLLSLMNLVSLRVVLSVLVSGWLITTIIFILDCLVYLYNKIIKPN